ncbi:MAG TPA: HEAT repeat domain-containing protein, partial [Rhodothermia bacterium]|nr:HEAT repeat domain-containing protein [Rhodothermia bacterium]
GGKEYMQFKVWQAVRKYLRYVKEKHIIRPMEYRRYDTLDEIYNEEHTYLKGGAVLHMLRWILGDQDFFRSLSYYLHKHEFSNVESSDLQIAIEEATGKNLSWFFDQWVYGAGHPRFEVSYRYHQDRKALDLTVNQTQPLVEGQGIFKLPVEVRIDTNSKTVCDTVWVENKTDHFTFSIDEKPRMVSFDGHGMLVCELVFDKKIAELTYQVQHDALPGRLWALRQLVRNYPGSPATLEAIRTVLVGVGSWWLKAEAALQLGNIHSLTGEQLLIDQLKANDYHVRKAAVIALGSHYTVTASSALRRAVESDPQTDVASAAIVSLATVDSSLAPSFLRVQMSRQSWYEELRIASLKAVEILASEKFVPLVKEYASLEHKMAVREQALIAWAACAPSDPALTDALIASARSEILHVRKKAIELLGRLKPERALPALIELSRRDGDGDIRKGAEDAAEEIQSLARRR